MQPIPARQDVSAAIFHEIRAAAEPIVLKGLVADWPIVRADDAAGWLRGHATTQPVHFMRAPPEVEGRLHYGAGAAGRNFERGEATLSDFLDLLASAEGIDRPEVLALQSLPAVNLLLDFADAHPMPLLPAGLMPRLWIGNAAKVATHHDPSENIACVVAGRRRFTLFPPEQVRNLYMGPFEPTPAGVQVSMVHVTAPDFVRYPRFAEALDAALVAELDPGDALYIPYQWYHHVEALDTFNVLVNYWWDPRRADIGSPWDAMMAGMMSLRTLPADQRRAWRAMFDHYIFLAHGDPAAHLPAEARGILAANSPRNVAQMRSALLAKLKDS